MLFLSCIAVFPCIHSIVCLRGSKKSAACCTCDLRINCSQEQNVAIYRLLLKGKMVGRVGPELGFPFLWCVVRVWGLIRSGPVAEGSEQWAGHDHWHPPNTHSHTFPVFCHAASLLPCCWGDHTSMVLVYSLLSPPSNTLELGSKS